MNIATEVQKTKADQSYIVVHDPLGEYWEGGIVDGARARQLAARGVVLLPCVPDIFRTSGVAGFTKRAWGAGYPLDSRHPIVVCPLTLYCIRGMRGIHWAMRLVTDPELAERAREGEKFAGLIRFAADRNQHTPFFSGVSTREKHVQVEELPSPDDDNGWTLTGSGEINVSQDGHYGFGLYAQAPGLRAVWLAATTTVT